MTPSQSWQLLEVGTDAALIREFLQLPITLYKNEKNWVRPLDKDIEDVFSPSANKLFRHGEATRWVLKDSAGKTVGRVAAFIDQKLVHKNNVQPTGGMGFFECINDQSAAFGLFDGAKAWLQQRGMEAMDGPINFGDRDRWWGLQLSGFEFPPNYCCNHHFPYYKELFEAYGFRLYFEQYTYHRFVEGELDPVVFAKSDRVAKDPNFRFEHLRKNTLDKYTEDFRIVYNKAWARHAGVASMPSAQAKAIMKRLKPVLDERLIWFGYYGEEPISFFIMLPELNQIFRHVNGKLDWIGKLKFLYYRYFSGLTKMFGVAFGVVPEYQGRGVEGAMVVAASKLVQYSSDMPYKEMEMNWIGSFNPKMMHVAELMGGKVRKVHGTYRKLFNPDQEWVPMPTI